MTLSGRHVDCLGWRGKGVPGQAAALRLRGLRCAPTALRCSGCRPRRGTHFAHCVRSVQTTATSQFLMRAARAANSLPLLGASQARHSLPERAFADSVFVVVEKQPPQASRQAVSGGGELCGDEKRRPGVVARSALRPLTRRGCLNAVSAANRVSSATRPQAEHRSAVGLPGRPPRCEPLPGTACREAQTNRGLPVATPWSP